MGHAKLLKKNIEDIEKLHNDVYFIDVDADEADEIVSKYEIRGVPVILIFKNGELISKTMGVRTQADLEDILN